MKLNLMITMVLFLSLAGTALAGSEYERCIKEEKTLKALEASDCSGIRYLFNPSACFAAQKKVKEYAAGKCRKIGLAENVDFNSQTVVQEKKNISAVSTGQKQATPEVPGQDRTLEELKDENNRLREEISRLKEENEGLRKIGR